MKLKTLTNNLLIMNTTIITKNIHPFYHQTINSMKNQVIQYGSRLIKYLTLFINLGQAIMEKTIATMAEKFIKINTWQSRYKYTSNNT